MHILAVVLLVVFSMPIQSRAIECPKIPEQTNKDWDVAVKAAVVRIGPVKGAELETQTRKATRDLMGKLPQADKVYLEQMMYATYCSALRDDKTISESEKARRIRAYNLEVKKSLGTAKGKKESDNKKAPQKDGRLEARAQLAQLSLPFTPEAFIDSVKKGDIDAVKLYLAGGMDPNSWDDYYRTALTYAVSKGHRQIIDLLLKAKADVNKIDWRLMSWATERDKRDILPVLLDHGANMDSITTAFVSAAYEGDVDLLKMLMAKGADIKATRDGKPILNLALRNLIYHPSSVSEKNADDTVEFLLDHGADINARFGEETALFMAVERDYEVMVRTLLKRGADPNCDGCSDDGFTPLMIAVRHSKLNIVRALLDKGADINAKNKEGITALMMAAMHSRVEIVKSLLERGADTADKDTYGRTALDLAGKSVLAGEEKEKLTLLLKMAAEKKK